MDTENKKQEYIVDFNDITTLKGKHNSKDTSSFKDISSSGNTNYREKLHNLLKESLKLPEYYGKNLDALHDCLTEMGECTITFRNLSSLSPLGEYGASLLKVLEDSAHENKELTLIFYK